MDQNNTDNIWPASDEAQDTFLGQVAASNDLITDIGVTAEDVPNVTFSRSKLELAQTLLLTIKDSSQRVIELLNGQLSEAEARSFIGHTRADALEGGDGSVVIEGVFNGQCMIGPDGKQYSMPANYASKSKLVEGDILKLTILSTGKFIYKQIGPIERSRVVGTLVSGNEFSEYIVEKDGRRWKILTASVTYFKGRPGDEAVVLVPKAGESAWAAVENIINKS